MITKIILSLDYILLKIQNNSFQSGIIIWKIDQPSMILYNFNLDIIQMYLIYKKKY